ncbi:MAG: metal-dependent hydrolase [Planctomycetota bacterium]
MGGRNTPRGHPGQIVNPLHRDILPTVITHSFTGILGGSIVFGRGMPVRFWLLSVACTVLPDADVIAFSFGIPYGHFFGHRGFFHSPFFAICCSFVLLCVFMRGVKSFLKQWWIYWGYFSLLMASHGILDAFTNGGLGIALLSPFSNTRYFFPWTPIEVSAIGGLSVLFTQRFMVVLWSEIYLIWIPLLIIFLLKAVIKHRCSKGIYADGS